MNPALLYITAHNREEAISITHELLSSRLIACANIVEHANSLYRWQGEIEQKNESLIIAKTLSSLVPQITEAVKKLHSYECPCVVSLPIENGNPEYLEWLTAQVTPPNT